MRCVLHTTCCRSDTRPIPNYPALGPLPGMVPSKPAWSPACSCPQPPRPRRQLTDTVLASVEDETIQTQ